MSYTYQLDNLLSKLENGQNQQEYKLSNIERHITATYLFEFMRNVGIRFSLEKLNYLLEKSTNQGIDVVHLGPSLFYKKLEEIYNACSQSKEWHSLCFQDTLDKILGDEVK